MEGCTGCTPVEGCTGFTAETGGWVLLTGGWTASPGAGAPPAGGNAPEAGALAPLDGVAAALPLAPTLAPAAVDPALAPPLAPPLAPGAPRLGMDAAAKIIEPTKTNFFPKCFINFSSWLNYRLTLPNSVDYATKKALPKLLKTNK